MKINVGLIQNYGKCDCNKVILQTNEVLTINFNHPFINCECYVHSENEEVKLVQRGEVIDFKHLKDGELKITVVLIRDGRKIKSYSVEPIIIQNNVEDYEIMPQIPQMQDEIRLFENRMIDRLNEELTQMRDEVDLLHKLVYTLIESEEE